MADFMERITELEAKNAELERKLDAAYRLNARESSLEAERIKANLSKDFGWLYEDFLEYDNSEVSAENYESLQAILKKAFRALERNGIDFKRG